MSASVGQVFRQAGRSAAITSKATAGTTGAPARHILIKNLLRSTTPADIRSALERVQAKDVQEVALDYSHFQPTGRAIVTLSTPKSLSGNLLAMKNLAIGGTAIECEPLHFTGNLLQRSRGVKGRLEAARRGALPGDGPHAGVSGGEQNVIITGLPLIFDESCLATLLKNFSLVRSEDGQPEISLVPVPDQEYSRVTRFRVKLVSATEAHRLVRRLHVTYYDEANLHNEYPLRAHVLY